MATDAVLQFKYSDDVHITAIYKRYDADPELVAESLKKYLRDTKNEQWDFIVADIIGHFVNDSHNRKGIKMVYKMPSKKDRSFCYSWQIFPKEDDFQNANIPLNKSIHVKVWRGSMRELMYEGPLANFKMQPDE